MREVRELPNSPLLVDKLVAFERLQLRQQYKFGVLLSKGQRNEDAIYGNQRGSRAYRRFVAFLGHSVDLATYDGYLGGLQSTGDTGERSVSARVDRNEIMYHVATMLPHSSTDKQQLERKRHLGNDIVVVVFEDFDESEPVPEGEKPPVAFKPDIVGSHFNHVFVVVRAVQQASMPLCFRVTAVHYKNCDDVDAFGPTLPDELDETSADHQRLFASFLINAERAAYRTATFRAKAARTNTRLLADAIEQTKWKWRIFKKIQKKKKKKKILKKKK